ncbi:MAG: GIY-YIG nuclease family protein [Akkermansiaceae bacterium]|nr:GIY-YIG nuclease family protein [Akkermansiaceae bacterium]
MNHGKQLRLFLPDGTPSGPRYYELVNWTGQALQIPLNRIKDLTSGSWPEFQRPGVYMVRGQSEEGHPRLYIGESEDVANRVQAHPSGLGFEISDILLFSSKDDNLSKSHVLWLEIQLIQRAEKAKRITLTNSKHPPLKELSRAEEATMKEFIDHLELVAQTASFGYFSEVVSKVTKKKFKLYLSMPQVGIEATAIRTDEGFLVLEGSGASETAKPALSPGYASQREDLIEKGMLVPSKEGKLIFTADCPFASPSAAAAIIAGGPRSGPECWKDESGTTLKDLIKKEEAANAGDHED